MYFISKGNASSCPGDTPMEVWRYIEERAVGVLTRLFGTMLQSERGGVEKKSTGTDF